MLKAFGIVGCVLVGVYLVTWGAYLLARRIQRGDCSPEVAAFCRSLEAFLAPLAIGDIIALFALIVIYTLIQVCYLFRLCQW